VPSPVTPHSLRATAQRLRPTTGAAAALTLAKQVIDVLLEAGFGADEARKGTYGRGALQIETRAVPLADVPSASGDN
jgi:hypothetical protein